jgi:hypothetical protein
MPQVACGQAHGARDLAGLIPFSRADISSSEQRTSDRPNSGRLLVVTKLQHARKRARISFQPKRRRTEMSYYRPRPALEPVVADRDVMSPCARVERPWPVPPVEPAAESDPTDTAAHVEKEDASGRPARIG